MAGRRGSDVTSPERRDDPLKTDHVKGIRWAEENTTTPSEQVDTAASVATEDAKEDSSSSDSSSDSDGDNL